MKKSISITIFLIIILVANISFASYNTVTMTVVDEPICTIELGENSSFEKKLVSKNLPNKEVTIELKVTNGEKSLKPTGEIILVLDNSASMKNTTASGEERQTLVFEAAKTLISNLLEDNDNLEIGIVSFSTNLDISKEGTIEDATVLSPLSNNISNLQNTITNIDEYGPKTNLQSGLLLASNQFSNEENNKYIITLTDGVPNVAIDYDNQYYSDDVIDKTKAQLIALENDNIKLITMLTGITDEDNIPNPSVSTKSFSDIIFEIFGTIDNPTAGEFLYISDEEIQETVINNIYNSLLPTAKTLKDITIIDYFPQEIINNFEFAYVQNTNIGNISTSINTSENSITWTIPELASGETATVQYTLKLKENFNENIVDEILNTNEKVDISYTDYNDVEQSKTSDVSPKLKLSLPPAKLPAAGLTLFIGLVVLSSVGLVVFFGMKYITINKNMKY